MLTFLQVNGLVYVADEPELKYTPNQTAVCSFSVAANRSWKNNAGTVKEESCFISVTAWKKLAESISKNVKKGDPLFVNGSLKQESWEKDNIKHTKHTLLLDKAIYLKPKQS